MPTGAVHAGAEEALAPGAGGLGSGRCGPLIRSAPDVGLNVGIEVAGPGVTAVGRATGSWALADYS